MSKDDSLRDLIERVERATGPDRELDALIQRALGQDTGEHWFADRSGKWVSDDHAPLYSASLDDILTLIDPADEWELSTLYNIARATVGLNRDHQTAWPGYGEHKGGNLVLALLSASLRAQMGTGG